MRTRQFTILGAISITSFLGMVPSAHAQNQTVTQSGHWSFDYPAYERTGEFRCAPVKFPEPFAGVPKVVFNNSTVNRNFVQVLRFDDITAEGFTPVLYRGGGRGGKPGGTVQGDWVATGPRKNPPSTPPSDTSTQVGHWSFDYAGYEITGEFRCASVKFLQPFRGVPKLVLVNSAVNRNFVQVVRFEDLTAQGFTPVLYRGGGRGGKPAGTASGDWIATGPPLNPSVTPSGDTFVQSGHWSASYPGYEATGEYRCPFVSFPEIYGAIPGVVFTNNEGGSKFVQVSRNEITEKGFTPVLYRGGGRGGKAGGTASGDWFAVGSRLFQGSAVPKYIVLTVIYSPPGTNGGKSSSSVSYQSGSTTGTTTSASQAFKVSNATSIETSGGFLGSGGGMGLSFEFSRSTTDSQSLDIKKTKTATIAQAGPSQDGINHDLDEIWLLLKPTVNLSLTSSSATWMLANTKDSIIQYVHVGWLNGHQTMPPGVAAALRSAGVTPQDYPDILARDPLSSGANPDPNRFLSLNTTFPYEPPYGPNDPVPTVTFSISNSSTSSTGKAVEDGYRVGLTLSATGGFLDFAKATLKNTTNWEWTNKSSQGASSGTSESASLTIGGPGFGYSGNTVMQVYYDQVYRTFAFQLMPISNQSSVIGGSLSDASGKPLPQAEVLLEANGKKHRTFTNQLGEYKFVGSFSGPASIVSGTANYSTAEDISKVNRIPALKLR